MNKLITSFFAVWLTAAAVLATEGINLIGIGPVQQGTAGAGVASAKDSSWLILNPAGLTDVEKSAEASFQYFSPNRTLNSTMSGGAGKQRDNDGFVIPSLSASFGQLGDSGGYIGFGVYGTSGMGVDYNNGRIGGGGFPPSSPQSQVDTLTELAVAKATVTYAQSFDNGFSIGAGPVFVLSRLRTDMINAKFIPQSGDWDTALGVGAIIGVNQKIGDRLTLGASYISEQFMTEFDEYNELLDGPLNLPQQLTVGLAYDLLDNLELAVDYRWIGWNKLDTLGDQFGWEDQRIIKAGLTWEVNDKWTLRSGISHGNSPVGSEDVFANALFPAIMETHVTLGASYQIDDRLAVHVAYVHALKETLTDDSGSFGTGTEISMSQNSATIGLSWAF